MFHYIITSLFQCLHIPLNVYILLSIQCHIPFYNCPSFQSNISHSMFTFHFFSNIYHLLLHLSFYSILYSIPYLSLIDFELKKVLLPPPLGNFADISYLEENFKPHLLRDVCTLCSGALVSDSLLHMLL